MLSRHSTPFASAIIPLIFCACSLLPSVVEASCSCQNTIVASASIPTTRKSRRSHYRHSSTVAQDTAFLQRRRRNPIFSGGWKGQRSSFYDVFYEDSAAAVHLVSRRTNKQPQQTDNAEKKRDKKRKNSKGSASDTELEDENEAPLTFADLPLAGKIVAGAVEIAVVTAVEYVSSFVGFYMLGTVWGLPGLVIGNRNAPKVATSFLQGASRRLGRMHQRSVRWGNLWGGVSAVVGGTEVAVRVLRGGKDDDAWSTILSSMAMGAFFFRKEGPLGMLKGAIFYGAIVKLTSPYMSMTRKPETPPEFQDDTLVVE